MEFSPSKRVAGPSEGEPQEKSIKLSELQGLIDGAVQGALRTQGLVPHEALSHAPRKTQAQHHSHYVTQQTPQFQHPGQIAQMPAFNQGQTGQNLAIDSTMYDVDENVLLTDENDYNRMLLDCPIGNDCVNLIPIRFVNMHVHITLKLKIWQWHYINLALLCKRSPHERNKVHEINNIDEWVVVIRVYFFTLLQNPALEEGVKAKLAQNMFSYIHYVTDLSSHADWKYYDEQYRIYLQSSGDGPKGLAFGSYDFSLQDEAKRLGVPKSASTSSKKGNSVSVSSGRRARINEAYSILGNEHVPKGFCWLYQANVYCEGPPACKFKHECPSCPAPHNGHGLLSCQRRVPSQQRYQSGGGLSFPQPQASKYQTGTRGGDLSPSFARGAAGATQGLSPYFSPGVPQISGFPFPPPSQAPPPTPYLSPQQLSFNMTPPRHSKDKFWPKRK